MEEKSLKELELKGYPLFSREAIEMVIEDMRKVVASDRFNLNMFEYCEMNSYENKCEVCAGGAAVIFSMGADDFSANNWTSEEMKVAELFDNVRTGMFYAIESKLGIKIDQSVMSAYSDDMAEYSEDYHDEFFEAWENFAKAVPKAPRNAELTAKRLGYVMIGDAACAMEDLHQKLSNSISFSEREKQDLLTDLFNSIVPVPPETEWHFESVSVFTGVPLKKVRAKYLTPCG